MTCVVSFSGGAGSYITAKRCVEKYGKENVRLVFADTLIEHPTLYDFIDAVESFLNIEVITISDGRDPFEVFVDDKFMGNSRLATCSMKLKSNPFREYMEQNHSPDSTVLALGFDWSEGHRVDKAVKNWEPYKIIWPLGEPPYLDRIQMIDEIKADGLPVPELYTMGFTHNNCGGFCVKAGQAHFRRLLNNDRSAYLYFERREQYCYNAYDNLKPFLRVTVGGKLEYMTLKQFRNYIESGKECDLFDFGGCGCFSD